MIITSIILISLVVLLAKYLYDRIAYGGRYEYVSPYTLKEDIKNQLATKSQNFMDNLRSTTSVDKVLRFKAENFFNYFLIGVQQSREFKPSMYEQITESLLDYMAYFLLHVDLCKDNGIVIEWPLLERNLKEISEKVIKIEEFVTSRIDDKKKDRLQSVQASLLLNCRDFKGLRDLLYK